MSSPGHPSNPPLSQLSDDDDDGLSVDLLAPTQNSLVASPVGTALPDLESIMNPDARIAYTRPSSRPPSPSSEMTSLRLFGLHSRLNPSGKVVNPYENARHTFLGLANPPDADNDVRDDDDDDGNGDGYDNGDDDVEGNCDGDDDVHGDASDGTINDDDASGTINDDDASNEDDASEGSDNDDDASNEDDASEGTIVPGTQLLPSGVQQPTPYDRISVGLRREAIGRQVSHSDCDVAGVDPDHEMIIRQVMLDDWGIRHPREFQIRAVHSLAFQRDRILYLIAKTGSGKSAVPLTVGSLCNGITLTMVPLVGLGSDQVSKSTKESNFIEAYHLDEHMGTDAQVLTKRLLALNEREAKCVSIFLYVSPQSLQQGTFWHKLLVTLSGRNMIRLIVIDEAHAVSLDGRDFRPEFHTAAKTLKSLYDNSPTKCNRLVMSATFRKSDQDVITNLYQRPPDEIIWLELSRRQIVFEVNVCGVPSISITSSVAQDLKDPDTDLKIIVYTNSKQQAIGAITEAMERVLKSCSINGDVISLTGDDGVQFKVWVMHAFGYDHSEVSDTMADDNCPPLPNLRIMPATKAADCGVSSHLCRRSYRNGIPPSMYAIVQEMGRVDRNPLAELGDNRYEIHISLGCVEKMYARIMQHPSPSERTLQYHSLIEVLRFLVCPGECQHSLMEKYFEDKDSRRSYEPCQNMCSKCNSSSNPITGRIDRSRAASLLVAYCAAKKRTTGELLQFVKAKQKDFFPEDIVLKYVGPFHAFCMQLIANGILHFRIADEKKYLIGKKELSPKSVVVELASKNGELCALSDSYWGGIRLVNES
jgi:superfamily II DNA helicase RecQ